LVSLVPNLSQDTTDDDREDYADLDDQDTVSDYSGGQDANENTRLIGRGTKPSIRARVMNGVTTNPLFVAVLAGVLIGLIKPIQRGLIGDVEHSTGGWQTLGGGLILLAGAYAAVEMVAIGATIRAGEAKCVWSLTLYGDLG
jgi:predicted permease